MSMSITGAFLNISLLIQISPTATSEVPQISPVDYAQLGVSLITLALLILTAYLSIQTYVFQIRTGIREAIEQLDDLAVANAKYKVILRDFNYFSLTRGVVLEFKFYSVEEPKLSGAARPENTKARLDEVGFSAEYINDIEKSEIIKNISVESEGLHLYCNSFDPVEIRQVAHDVFAVISRQYP